MEQAAPRRRRVPRRLIAVVVAIALLVVAVRMADVATPLWGYRILDDYNIAVQITTASWLTSHVTVLRETASTVTVGVSQIGLQLGPGFGGEIAYVAIRLNDPLGSRMVIDATTSQEVSRLGQ